jgi:hypothetical protein
MRDFGSSPVPVGVLLLVVGCYCFVRTLLIISGRLKSPLLRTFERYDDRPRLLNSARDLAASVACAMAGFYALVISRHTLPAIALMPMFAALAFVLLAHEQAAFIRTWLPLLMPLPTWYVDILSRTSAHERRHLAYMWLGLPRRVRQRYEQDDSQFLRWADLVITSTTL